MDPVVHFEIPVENRDRAAEFYTRAFGWQASKMGQEMGNYVVVTTTEVDPKTFRPVTPGAINGGLYTKQPDHPAQYPSVVIAVEDITRSMENVKSAGGEVMGEPDDIPGVGRYVSIKDSEGNRVALLQAEPNMPRTN